MGKTRTAFISDASDEKSSGKTKYEEKRKKQKEQKEKEALKKKQVVKVGLKGGERIKVVGAELSEKEKDSTKESKEKEKTRAPKKRGKKYSESQNQVDKTKLYPLKDAIKLVKKTSYSKFDGTVELHLVVKKLGLSTNVKLPNSTGKKNKIEITDKNTIEKLKKGKIDFDVLLATAEMMPKLVPFAKLLGPKGLMPNPKTGTLIKSAKDAAKFSGNSITLKTERAVPVIHTTVGKISQKEKELEENTQAIIDAVDKRQIGKAVLSATMGPGVKVAVQ